ncbi:MAG: hypothetical protein IKT06_02210 [Aeriscardovia sp.]|nr:hypothetical protein [Aeriscardovia sp.]
MSSGLLAMKMRYEKWCKEFGIPEQEVNLKFWLSGQYGKTRREVEALKKAEKEPIPPAPKID